MPPLAKWSLRDALGVAVAWMASVILVAFLTPPGRFMVLVYRLSREYGNADRSINITLPFSPTVLTVWWIATPALAFLPAAGLLAAWWWARRRVASQAAV